MESVHREYAHQAAGNQHSLVTFDELVRQLSDVLGPSSGLDSEDVDIEHVQDVMKGYTSKQDEWQRYALEDSSRAYTRNLVDEGNGKSNLVHPPSTHILPRLSYRIC